MTSHPRRDNDSMVFTSKTPHFFKIILDQTLQDGKLGIPRRFVRKYGNDLPNSVLLKVPSGAVWPVELTKCDGDVWLQNGLQEFAEYYSLAHGHLLVFSYEENSHFSVVIFDMSTSEIEYPYKSSDSDGEFQEPKMYESEDDIYVEILDHNLPYPKRREISPFQCPRPHKLLRTNSTNNIEGTSNLQTLFWTHSEEEEVEEFKRNIDSQCSTQELGGVHSPATKGGEGTSTGQRGSQSKILGRMQPLTGEKAKNLQRASAFKSDNPFFMVTMQPSYVHLEWGLNIPAAFARKHLIMKQGDVILYISDGRTWSIKYQRGASNCNPRAKLSVGWSAFAQDNHLEVGDVCVFELMKGTEISLISFKVIIFRLVEDANCHMSAADENGANRVKSDCVSDHANGVPSLHHQNSTKKFTVPKIEENENDIFVETLDDISPCLKAKEKSPSPYLQSHKKRETNPCGNIERISKTQTLAPPCCPQGTKGLKLKKSKRNINLHNSTTQFGAKEEGGGGGKSTVTKCLKSEVLGRMLPLTPKEKARALQRASAFKSKNPFFVVAMQPSYVHPGYNLNIPFKFAKRYFNEKHRAVMLRVSDGRNWAVKYNAEVHNIARPKAYFNYTDWMVFAQENNLRVGDVCIFELINGFENSLNVVIFPVEKDLNCSLSRGNLKQLIHEESTDRQCTQRSSCSRFPGALEAASKCISSSSA